MAGGSNFSATLNMMGPRQNGRFFPDDIFKYNV